MFNCIYTLPIPMITNSFHLRNFESLTLIGACAAGLWQLFCICVCACLYPSVTMKAATYLVYRSKVRCHRVLYCVFKVFDVWIWLKTFRSKGLASFAGRHCLPHFLMISQWTRETVMVSFQCKECTYLAIASITHCN